MSTKTEAARLPRSIARGLRQVDRRLRVLSAVAGTGTLLAVLSLGIVVGIAADLIFILPRWSRWLLWVAWWAATVGVVVLGIVRPLVRRTSWTALAAVARKVRPDLGDDLVGAVDLLEHAGRAHGSPQLISALIENTDQRLSGLDSSPAEALPSRWALRRLALGLVMTALVAVPLLFRSDPYGTLVRRFLMPWSGVERVGRYLVTIRDGDRVVALGDDVPITAEVRPRWGRQTTTDTARILWTDTGGASHSAPMAADPAAPDGSRVWRVTIPTVGDSLRVRVQSGTSRSGEVQVRAVDPLAVGTLAAKVTPPPYTKEPAFDAEDPARIDAREGSRVELRLSANRPLSSAAVAWPVVADGDAAPSQKRHPLQPVDSERREWSVVVTADAPGTYRFDLLDEFRLSARHEPTRRVLVRPDRPPTIALLDPEAEAVSVTAQDTLPIRLEARDDLAVESLQIEYTIARAGTDAPAETSQIPARLAGLGSPHVRGEIALGLPPLRLRPGDSVAYRVAAIDNREPEPNVTWSDSRQLQIVATADPLAGRRAAAERALLQKSLDALKRDAAANRKATETLRYAADAATRPDGRWDSAQQTALQQREAAQRDLIDRLHEFAHQLDESGRFGRLARPARQLADVEAETARSQLETAAQARDARPRLEELKKADTSLAAVVGRLEELQRRFEEASRAEDDRNRLAALANDQERLAEQAGEIPAGDRARLDQAQAEQGRLARELEETLNRSPDLKADALAQRVQDAEELSREARQLADRQREAARRTADLSGRAAELRALVDQQRSLEDDARRFALQVDTPLSENGRGRLNTDALAAPVEPLSRGDLEQSRQRLDAAEFELNRMARDLEELRDDPRAFARRLSQREEQLRQQAVETIREALPDPDNATDEDRERLATRLRPLIERQEALMALTAALPVPQDREAARRTAQEHQQAAAEGLREPSPQPVDQRLSQARDALANLANALPDPNQQRQQVRQRMEEARRRTHEVANEIERHLRETGPQPGKPHDAQRAAAELADRLAPLAQKAAEAAAELRALAPAPGLEAHRERAARRAEALARGLAAANRDALQALADDARAAADRLTQKADGRTPADEDAARLAAQLGALAEGREPLDGQGHENEIRRIATALQGLEAPDAPLAAAEAARTALRAVADPASLPAAIEAAERLARRLTDQSPPEEQAEALARAEAALNAEAAPADPDHGSAVQHVASRELARLRAIAKLPEAPANQAAETVRQAMELADRAGRADDSDPSPRPDDTMLRKSRDAAAEALAALARASAPANQREIAKPSLRPEAETLLQRQRELADRIQAVHEQARSNPDRNAALAALTDQVAPLRESQRGIIGETIAGVDPRSGQAPERRASEQHRMAAVVAGERAAEALARRDTERAAALAREAVGQLEQLALSLPTAPPEPDPSQRPVPTDPELAVTPAHIDAARELAGRERRIRERLQSLLAERIPDQQNIRQDSAALAERFHQLREDTRAISPRAEGPAQGAEEMLGRHAPAVMDQAAGQLAQGQAGAARESQRRAAEMLERAAHQAEDLAGAIRADIPPDARPAAHAEAIARAQDAQRRAVRDLAAARQSTDQRDRPSAAGAMREAADALRVAAQPRDSGESSTDPPGDRAASSETPAPDPQSRPAGRAEADLARLQDLVRRRTGRSWGELPGHLRTEILQMSQGRYRDDYARLIQLYFQEIAGADR